MAEETGTWYTMNVVLCWLEIIVVMWKCNVHAVTKFEQQTSRLGSLKASVTTRTCTIKASRVCLVVFCPAWPVTLVRCLAISDLFVAFKLSRFDRCSSFGTSLCVRVRVGVTTSNDQIVQIT